MIQAILFDLDGTLWDSSVTVCAVWNRVFTRHGVAARVTPEEVRGQMGRTVEAIGEFLMPEQTAAQRAAVMDEICREETEMLRKTGGRLFDGLVNTLETLHRRYRLMIVSNCQEGYIEAFLAAHGLGRYFDDFENSGRTGLAKSGNIRLMMERNRLEKAIYVGDTALDRAAAAEAGIPFIYAAYGFGHMEHDGAAIRSLRELPAAADAEEA